MPENENESLEKIDFLDKDGLAEYHHNLIKHGIEVTYTPTGETNERGWGIKSTRAFFGAINETYGNILTDPIIAFGVSADPNIMWIEPGYTEAFSIPSDGVADLMDRFGGENPGQHKGYTYAYTISGGDGEWDYLANTNFASVAEMKEKIAAFCNTHDWYIGGLIPLFELSYGDVNNTTEVFDPREDMLKEMAMGMYYTKDSNNRLVYDGSAWADEAIKTIDKVSQSVNFTTYFRLNGIFAWSTVNDWTIPTDKDAYVSNLPGLPVDNICVALKAMLSDESSISLTQNTNAYMECDVLVTNDEYNDAYWYSPSFPAEDLATLEPKLHLKTKLFTVKPYAVAANEQLVAKQLALIERSYDSDSIFKLDKKPYLFGYTQTNGDVPCEAIQDYENISNIEAFFIFTGTRATDATRLTINGLPIWQGKGSSYATWADLGHINHLVKISNDWYIL